MASAPDPAVAAARDCAAALAATAGALERNGVTRPVLDDLAARGLLGVYGPAELGGVPEPAQREVAELLAGASPDAWLVWFQHGPVVRMLAGSENAPMKERYLAALCRGELLGGVSYSHLRTPAPSVFAERVEGGWTFSGVQPWCTGWGLVDVLLAGALARDRDEVVFAVVPADRTGVASDGALQLAAMGGSHTHRLRYDNFLVRDEEVLACVPRSPWATRDNANNTNVQPSTPGIALAALDLLQDDAPAVAGPLRQRVLVARAEAYRLLDVVPYDERLDERLAVRARLLLLAVEATTALLTARGGRGMDLGDPAQRLLRAAAFQLVHSSARHVKAAVLAGLVSAPVI